MFKGNDRKNIVGIFRTKRLIDKDPEDSLTMDQFNLTLPLVVGAGQSPLTVLNLFQQGSSHIALVSHDPNALLNAIENGVSPAASFEPIGIVTLEDVIEAMLQSEIYDEDDRNDQTATHASSELFNLSMSASRTTSPAAEQQKEELAPLPAKPPSLLKSLSETLSRPFSSKERSGGGGGSTSLGGGNGRVDQAIHINGKESSKLAAANYDSTPNYQSVEEGVRGTRSNTVGSGSGSDTRAFYKRHDGLYDALGEPLIPSQYGAHSRQREGQTNNFRAESNHFGRNLVDGANSKSRKITPSLVNKYVTTGKIYKGNEAPARFRAKSESPRSRSAKT